jgi:hypothetical protein
VEFDELIDRFGDPKTPYTYSECKKRGHDFQEPKVEWFRWGWRLPWRTHSIFRICAGCGIGQFTGARSWVWPKFRE